ncbi:MAG TPA: protein translocase subunit SecF [Chloroflexota bacterium]|nr:protein translocase subunit SecF [Chloroflexota bacterium]
MINLIKYRYWYFLLSLVIIVPGTLFLIGGGLKGGIDFVGGSELTFQFPHHAPSSTIQTQLINAAKNNAKLNEAEVISATPFGGGTATANYLLRIPNIGNDPQKLAQIEAALYSEYGCGNLARPLPDGSYKVPLAKCGNVVLTQENDVGPTIGAQIKNRAVQAVLIAALFILLYISYAFRKVAHPFRYGTCAIVALLHDVLVVLGLFAIFGRLLGVTVDSLFVTAVLTVVGFSVHDTIVIFDRIRENMSRRVGEPFELIVNNAILQSMARSLNTSLTVLLTLTALLIFGGASIRIFVLTLLVGITSGTYSSIFNASPLLVVWENDELGIGKLFRRKKKDVVQPRGRAGASQTR